MAQQIAERDYVAEIRDAARQSRIAFRKLVQRLTDDLKFLLDRGTGNLILRLSTGVEGTGEPGDGISSVLDVPQKASRVTIHRRSRAIDRC